jgi:methionyl-tRNA formyltransferase
MKLTPPAVKERALALSVPVLQPTKMKDPALAEALRACGADVGVVVAYGRILPRALLDAPRLGCLNVHGSILPRWRGAAPIQWAVASGDTETGVCLMQMDEGLDTGPVLACKRTAIGSEETAGALAERLSVMGGAILREELGRYVAGELAATPQDAALATHARLLEKNDGRVDWEGSASQVSAWIRGMTPWPGAFTTLGGEALKIHRATIEASDGTLGDPGAIVEGTAGLAVACGAGSIRVHEIQEAGRKRLDAAQFLTGRSLPTGTRLGNRDEDLHEDG